MRKALIGILMGATMVTPVAVSAQAADADRGAIRAERQAQRAERQEQRAQRVQERQAQRSVEPRAVRTETRAQVPAASWPGQRERSRQVLRQAERNQNVAPVVTERREARQDRSEVRAERRDDRRDVRQDRREDRREVRVERRDDRRDFRQDRREIRQDRRADGRNWNRNWRKDNRYDWQRWRSSNRNIFNIGRYYAPYRHNYSRFSIGFRIGSPFYSNRYWISDPWQYRLPPAYAGTRWVRYYDDVLLVDLYTGQVIDVIYDFFW